MLDYFLKGGPIMYPLLLCSLVSLTVIVERVLFWIREGRRRDQGLVNKVMGLTEKGDYDKAVEIAGTCGDYVAKVLFCGLVHREFSLISALEMAASNPSLKGNPHMVVLSSLPPYYKVYLQQIR